MSGSDKNIFNSKNFENGMEKVFLKLLLIIGEVIKIKDLKFINN